MNPQQHKVLIEIMDLDKFCISPTRLSRFLSELDERLKRAEDGSEPLDRVGYETLRKLCQNAVLGPVKEDPYLKALDDVEKYLEQPGMLPSRFFREFIDNLRKAHE